MIYFDIMDIPNAAAAKFKSIENTLMKEAQAADNVLQRHIRRVDQAIKNGHLSCIVRTSSREEIQKHIFKFFDNRGYKIEELESGNNKISWDNPKEICNGVEVGATFLDPRREK